MLKDRIQSLLHRYDLSLHRKSSIDNLLREIDQLRRKAHKPESPQLSTATEAPNDFSLQDEIQRLRKTLQEREDREIFYRTTEDYHAHDKMRHIVKRIPDFGHADFAELSCWLFAASLNNHRVVHQRIDEASLLWRAVKMSGGPILEVGRAAGGSTLLLLGASGTRPVVSIDRAPFHAFIAEEVFQRPDVAERLKLYVQTSREPIAENEFGMIFIDADHSYEGICHDIGAFWNSLRSFDGKPALAAFHDAADNPITYVEPVKQACEELLAEPGAARLVESWGSMLVLEKTGDIDEDRWFKKEHHAFWEQFADTKHPVLKPTVLSGRLHPEHEPLQTETANLLGDENVDHDSWVKRGVSVQRLSLNEDNPVRLVRVTPQPGEHAIEKTIPLNVSQFCFSVCLRPLNIDAARLSIFDDHGVPLARADFVLGLASRIRDTTAKSGIKIIDAAFLYRNGYFGCQLSIKLDAPLRSATFAVSALDAEFDRTNGLRGFFANLSSVRALK